MNRFVKTNSYINILLSTLFLLSSAFIFSSENDTISCREPQNIEIGGKGEGKSKKPKRRKFKFQSKVLRKTFKISNKFNKQHRNRVGKKRFRNRHSGAVGHRNKAFKQKKNKSKLKKKNFHDMNSRH